ncbi:exodeoxyribonuclease V [Streptomyces sp. NBC_01262]|nr:helix-hairpin-helix domain-containing protein [Streptomyces sp. NBC_01262]
MTDDHDAADAGTKLSPELRDLAAAVKAIERGEKPAAPAPRRAAAPQAPAAPVVPAAPAPTAAEPPRARPVIPSSADALSDARAVLAAGGAPETLAEPAVAALGERAGELLRENPWQVLALPGVRVEHADGFAKALLGGEGGPDDERRVRALVSWLLERAAEQGHTALEASVLQTALGKQSVADPEEALRAAVADGGVLVFHDAEDTPAKRTEEDEEAPVRLLFGLDRYALAEESLADGLNRLLNTFEGADDIPAEWEGAAAAASSPSAAALIRAAACSGLVAHTGGEAARAEPVALVAAARALGLRAYAAAYARADGDTVLTVADLLAGAQGPGRDEDGSLALDLLAVLDAPMLDVESAATLVEAVPDGARLVLSGDPGVLWSVGPGRAFADLLAAKTCPQVASRTPDPGPIGELVSGIGIGELEQVEAPGKEVVTVPVRDAGEAVHRTVQLVADSVPRAIGVPADRTQVITPGHGGAAGTRVLNAALKERLNPGPGRFGGFDPGDRVVHGAAFGTVLTADADGLHLDCDGTPLVVPRDAVAAGAVRHGWAVTAHQAAGMRWPAAVVVLPGDAGGALTRAWAYTAFGRGERHLSVVQGVGEALARTVAELPAKPRTTRLRAVLREQAGGA